MNTSIHLGIQLSTKIGIKISLPYALNTSTSPDPTTKPTPVEIIPIADMLNVEKKLEEYSINFGEQKIYCSQTVMSSLTLAEKRQISLNNNYVALTDNDHQGQEAFLYRRGHVLAKLFKDHIKPEYIAGEVKFLQKYRKTGAVPIVLSNESDAIKFRTIKMQYLDGYVPLKRIKQIKNTLSISKINAFLKELVRQRAKIGRNVRYSDLHLKNVLVKMEPRMDIRFVDPGRATTFADSPEWITWLKETVGLLSMSRTEIGRVIHTGNENEIAKLL